MNSYSEISDLELEGKTNDLISEIEKKRNYIIKELNDLEKMLNSLKNLQEELSTRNGL